ncbi:hypothetical protein BJD99_18530 [Rhodococcus sp. 1163]|nr:hypothetical protein BJD99_18530 [Rhodococcus sp. 1163]
MSFFSLIAELRVNLDGRYLMFGWPEGERTDGSVRLDTARILLGIRLRIGWRRDFLPEGLTTS